MAKQEQILVIEPQHELKFRGKLLYKFSVQSTWVGLLSCTLLEIKLIRGITRLILP